MKGSLLYVPAEPVKARRLLYLCKPPSYSELQKILGGPFELIPELETIQQDATIKPCIAFCQHEARFEGKASNQWANLLWGLSLVRKYGPGRFDPGDTIKGPVLVITGDEEFLEAL